MTDDNIEQPIFLNLATAPNAKELIARELRLMAAAQGRYKDFGTVSPWTVCVWHAAAELLENMDAVVLAGLRPCNDREI